MSDMAATLRTYLPASDGWLPTWLLFLSVVSIGNSIQAYISLGPTQQVYAGSASDAKQSGKVPDGIPARTARTTSPVTPLSARTFGTWTALSSIIRLYAAYNIHDARIYELAFWTYIIAFGHFFSEWLVFGTARWGRGIAGPAIVSTTSIIWMWTQWNEYVSK